jgi:hypothetical protein
VRDLAGFAVRSAAGGITGAYNVTAPVGRDTFAGLLGACAEVTGSAAEFVWIPDAQLLACGVRQWSEMPLWRTFPGAWQVDSAAASARGLSCGPLAATVADTWRWMQDGGHVDDERAGEIGISPEREQQILASVGQIHSAGGPAGDGSASQSPMASSRRRAAGSSASSGAARTCLLLASRPDRDTFASGVCTVSTWPRTSSASSSSRCNRHPVASVAAVLPDPAR